MTQLEEPRSEHSQHDDNQLVQYAVDAALQTAIAKEARAFTSRNRHISNEAHTFTFTYTMSPTAIAAVKVCCVLSPERKWLQIAISVTRDNRKLSMKHIHWALHTVHEPPIVRLDEDDTLLYYIVPVDPI